MPARPNLATAARALVVDGWTAEILLALGDAGLNALLLKGPVLARWLYDPTEERGYGDADVLVRSESIPSAEAVLTRLGYALRDPEGERERMVSGPHARTWLRAGDGAVVDLHHTLPGDVRAADLVWDAFWTASETLAVGGAEVRVPDPTARLLIVAVHAAHHGATNPGAIEDLRRAVTRIPEAHWAGAAALARSVVALPRFAEGLALLPEGRHLAQRLGLSSPATLRMLEGQGTAAGFEQLARAHGTRERITLLRDELLPSAEFLRWWAPWARRSRRALAAAYVYRVGWLAAHALPGWRAWRRTRR